jgi:hypothetical protein
MSARFTVKFEPGALAKAFESKYQVMAVGATKAMGIVTEKAKEKARASIRAAGGNFVRRWPNALRSSVFPSGAKASASPAGLLYMRATYAGIVEEGGTIKGSPYLWIPLKNTPKRIGGKRVTPGSLRNLVTIRRPGKPPLLGMRVKATSTRFNQPVTASLLARGTSAKRGLVRVIPLFVGVPKAEIRKRFAVRQAAESAARDLPSIYFSVLKDS